MALVTRMTRPTRDAAPPPARRRGGEHGLRAPDVEAPAGPGGGVRRQVKVRVHDDIAAVQTAGQGRVANIGHPPRHAPDVAPLAIDREDLLDLPRRGEPGGYGGSDAARRPGYRHHGHRLMTRGAALGANRT